MIKILKGGAIFVALSLSTAVFSGNSVNDDKSSLNSKKQENNIKYTIAKHLNKGGQVCGTDDNGQVWIPSPGEMQFFNSSSNTASAQFQRNLSMEPKSIGSAENGEYIIPVVFHVYGAVHNCTTANGMCVTDEIIQDALRRTNEDFQGLNTLDGPISAEFMAIRENMNIEFVLAQVDPWGNATTGIVRHGEASGYGNYEAPNDAARAAKDAEISGDAWDNYRYMNVYIMNDLDGDGITNNSGVAWYPTTSMSDKGLARVVYNGDYVGNNADENFRSILTHEFGHWLNLPHVFHDNICNTDNEIFCSHSGDRVCDTPQMSNSSMANNANNCLGQATNTENFMHYTDNYAMFTQQQAQRMYAALNHPARKTLWTDSNLSAVGLGWYAIGDQHPWDGSGTDSPPAGVVLMELNGLSAAKGDISTYTIDLPVDTQVMAVYLDGYSEDPDLYLRHGQAPVYDGTNWTFDHNSFASAGTSEFIGIVSPKTTGTYFITVHAFSAYSNARLMVVQMDDPTLCSGCERVTAYEEHNIAALKGSAPKHYAITVPNDATRVMIEIPSGYGSTNAGGPDPDMYVSHNAIPTESVADCKPFAAPGLREVCEFTGPNLGGTYNIMIVPFLDYSLVTLRAVYDHPAGTVDLPPTANINGPYSGALNANIVFSSQGSSDPEGSTLSYSWNFGDGSALSTSANPTHSYSAEGSYTVTLTVTDPAGNTGAGNSTATITSTPIGGEIQNNGSVSGLSANTGETTGSYYIDVPSGASNLVISISGGTGDGDLFVQLDSEPSSSNYSCRPYDSGNNETCTIANPAAGLWYMNINAYSTFTGVTLTAKYEGGSINQPPVAVVNGPYTGETGRAINFSSAGSSDPEGGQLTYSWDFGDGSNTTTAANPSHAYSTAGNYTVTLTVTDDVQNSTSANAAVSVTDISTTTPPVANVNGPYSAEEGTAITFSSNGSNDPDGSIVSYRWDFSDGGSSTSINPSYTFNTAGDYSATLTVTDNDGLTGTSTTTVTITAKTVGNVLSKGVSISISGAQGSETIYTMEVPADATALSFAMSGGLGDADMYVKFGSAPTSNSYDCRPYKPSSNETCDINTVQGGTYYVMISGYDSYSGVSLVGDYTAGSGDLAPTANANGPYSGVINTAISFNSAGSSDPEGSALTYSWDFGDGSSLSTQANPSYSYLTSGNFSATLTVTDAIGQSSSSTASVTIVNTNPGGLEDTCTTQAPQDYVITDNGSPLCVTTGNDGSLYFYFNNDNGATQATIRTQHGTGDTSLYYDFNGWPSSTSYNQMSNNAGNTESIVVNNLASGWNYIMLDGTHSGVTLQVDLQ